MAVFIARPVYFAALVQWIVHAMDQEVSLRRHLASRLPGLGFEVSSIVSRLSRSFEKWYVMLLDPDPIHLSPWIEQR